MRHCVGGTRECHDRFPIDQSSCGTTVGVRSDLHFIVEGVKGRKWSKKRRTML